MKFQVKPVLFLDLDGTVRTTISGEPFAQSLEDVFLVDGVEERMWQYVDKGFLVIGLTNQGGVAYGLKTTEYVGQEIVEMLKLFTHRGLHHPFHHIESCFHHQSGNVSPYNVRSLSRKPSYGMMAQAERKVWSKGFGIDYFNSLMVGDRDSDRACALNAGIDYMDIKSFLEPHNIEIKQIDYGKRYILQRKGSYLGNAIQWWKKGGGYTYDVRLADVYGEDKALQMERGHERVKAHKFHDIMSNYKAQMMIVDSQYI